MLCLLQLFRLAQFQFKRLSHHFSSENARPNKGFPPPSIFPANARIRNIPERWVSISSKTSPFPLNIYAIDLVNFISLPGSSNKN
jgi:hypothetical protein